ncbi:acyl CoA:acetate/3-ketoacid CoA transferase [Geosporobacter ferrireducens]|uniref:Acyl CoA:acetate/3-ketoacid CoA transferase n=1 Tax=Geosporobacter ferrireducens TaxID=1424294 RepID=A0A1D8GFW9_9FIRM|nr:acyl CoA:acetate/3-ketoacid CoA transferase [Geosporobacter ferrireducens]AOT69802.1 acyl CoA:acetate/3-ketoacid CoA transferase [Geosporobacter ferrireducens]
MPKFITADEAAALVKDGATVALSAMGLGGWPEEIAEAIERRYIETGFPRDLNIKQGSATGDWKERGVTRFGHEGLVKKWTAAHIGSAAQMNALVQANKIEAHCLPQGVIVNLWREIAAKRPGLITKVGLQTFVDPRIDGGKMNSVTKEDLVKLIEIEGEEWLFYKSFPVDVALIRGTTADEKGNITMDREGFINEALAVAEATKNSGGIVIAQVEFLAKEGTLHPKQVKVPGVLIDYVVIAEKQESCWQTEGLYFEPSFAGDIKIPLNAIPRIPLDERKIIARRSAMELKEGMIVNLGFGIPADVAAIAAEEKISDRITLTTEAGAFGGIPASPPNFGNSYNAEAMIDHGAMFDFYDGGGLDITYLGLAQTDRHGNINVSKFGKRLTGPGGFINISQNARKVVFCGTFTAGAEVKVENGKLIIIKEGTKRKFISQVEQITFSGKYATSTHQPVLYVTERAVFKLEQGEMTLIEVAPGIDIQKDILAHMDFMPTISDQIKEMDASIFQHEWGGLQQMIKSTIASNELEVKKLA